MKRVYLASPVEMAGSLLNITAAASTLNAEMPSLKTVVYNPFEKISIETLKQKSAAGQNAVLMENVLADFESQTAEVDVVLVVGLSLSESPFLARQINESLALALDASVLLIAEQSELSLNNAACLEAELKEKRVRVSGIIQTENFVSKVQELLKEESTERKISQAAFRAGLLTRAGKQLKRIVLPEGNEVRTIQAAILAVERKIAIPVLLGKRAEIEQTAKTLGLKLPEGLEIIEVTEASGEKFVPTLVELRKAKGMTEELARDLLKDSVWLGTMMLKMGEVDGLVSGAVHSTADTVRPALQVIKTAPGVKSISSVFFMCLPSETLVYGDCAVNLNPTAEELAGIAAQCNDTAKMFGLSPRVALLSYSSGKSGKGDDVDLVRAACENVKANRPDILVDGPIQYDAATVPSVAAQKMPGSPVAGKANVFVFPNLNAGNICYKAVQRSAPNVISIGPMLQGLAKPVNDLSRGALVEDIVYTIALTAIQAQN